MEKSISILYVDDNRLDRELVRDALVNGSSEFKLVEAASRIQFDKQLAKGGYDLVLSDFNILGFEGLQVLETVHAKSPEIPVIIVTGTGSEEVAVNAMKLGAADYVIKTPSHIKHLPLTIHAVLEKVRLKAGRKQAEEKLIQAIQELHLLDEINNAAISGESFDKIIDKVVGAYTKLCYANSLTVYLYEKSEHRLIPQNVGINKTTAKKIEKITGINILDFAPILSDGYRFSEAIKSGESFITSDPEEIVSLYSEYTDNKKLQKLIKPVMKLTRIITAGGFPLIVNNEPIGLITFSSDSLVSEIDLERISRFSQQVSLVLEKVKTEKVLQDSEALFHTLAKVSPVGIFHTDTEGNCLYVNEKWCEIAGITQEEALKEGWVKGLHQDDREQIFAEWYKAAKENIPFMSEYRSQRRGDITTWVLGQALAEKSDTGEIVGYVGTITDITERKRAEEKIQKSLKEKEVLLKEIHHRVKNNLQVITSLLNLQSAQIKNMRNREAFISTRDRVSSIALVHEILYQSDDFTQVDFGKYLTKLTGLLLRLHKGRGASVALDLRVSSVMLVMDLAVPCGIVVNELITNALKHAFPKGQKGVITVSLKKKKRKLELIVQDNGVGISEQLEKEKSDSLGMNLVSILVEDQLNGTLKIEQNGGTVVKIQFPI